MTDNTFESNGGPQNTGQGKGSIGQQNNNYFTQPLKPKTLVIASLLGVGLLGTGFAGYYLLAPPPGKNSVVIKDNQHSGPTAVAQGAGATVNQTNNYSGDYYGGVSQQRFEELRDKYAVTGSALASFFKVLEEQQVPLGDLDSKLREIAGQYKELLARLDSVQSEDPQVVQLKQEAKQAIKAGDYPKAEELLNQAEARDVQAIEVQKKSIKEQQEALEKRQLSAAATNADQASLQRIQLRYAKAAEYWQKAAALLPEDQKKERSLYLSNAGYDFHRVARYNDALPLFEQSLVITQEIGDKAGEGTTLSNIGALHHAKGDYLTALKYLDQSLRITQEIGDKAGEDCTLNNIGNIYTAWGEYDKALKYLEQSLAIQREIGNRYGEGVTLNSISQIYKARGDYDKALKYLEQSLVIMQEIGDKAGEGTTLNNISQIYDARGDYPTALKYLEQSLAIMQEIGDKAGEGTTLNNIAGIHRARGDYPTALKYLEQSLAIMQEIGAKMEEAVMSWNIGLTYKDQGDLPKAEPYISRAVEFAEEIGHPSLEKYRKELTAVRAEIKGR